MKTAENDFAKAAAALALLIIAVFFVYWPGLNGGYVFDDLPNIVDNTQLHVTTLLWPDWITAIFSSPSSNLQRPLAMLTFAINHYFTGLDPRPMKLTNIFIHAANALLVFGLARALLRSWATADPAIERRKFGAALFVAAAWALHPINLMAVLFVVQRMESFCHSFVFAGLWLYVVGRQRQIAGDGGWVQILAGLFGCTAIGVLIKESAVLLPVYALCIEFCLLHFRGSEGRTDRRLSWLYLLTLVLPGVIGLAWLLPIVLEPSSFGGRNFNLAERLFTELRVVFDYLHWSVLPDLNQLSLYHDDYQVSRGFLRPASTSFALLALLTVFGAGCMLRRKRPLVALGIFWFFSAQALTATVIPLELMFEHRNYFASVGICLALADLLLLSPRTDKALRFRALLAGLLVFFYAAGTYLRASEWDHPVRFVATEVAKHPQSPRATYELARMLVVLSGYKKDSPYLAPAMAAIEKARRVPGSTTQPAQAALIVAARTGQPLQAVWWSDLTAKLRDQPLGPQPLGALAAMVDCANSGLCAFPRDEMMQAFSAAMTHGDSPELFNIYGSYVLNSLREYALAQSLWEEAVRLKPKEPQYHVNLGRLLIAMGKDEDARREIAALRRIGPLGQYENQALRLEADLRKRAPPTKLEQ
jgi:tetratricopeptide (TPR) repeat protein